RGRRLRGRRPAAACSTRPAAATTRAAAACAACPAAAAAPTAAAAALLLGDLILRGLRGHPAEGPRAGSGHLRGRAVVDVDRDGAAVDDDRAARLEPERGARVAQHLLALAGQVRRRADLERVAVD